MCLTLSKKTDKTQRYRRTIKSKGGKIICYKIVSKYRGGLVSRIRPSFHWKMGWNISSRAGMDDTMDDCRDEYRDINCGIHVYKRRPSNYYNNTYTSVIPVICNANDLVGANDVEAVFTKVFLTKKNYEKAVK